MRLDSRAVSLEGRTVTHIRVDRIGGSSGLWWVAEALSDGSSKPEGMFPARDDAMGLARELAANWSTRVVVSDS